jgi:hypothetical protein
MRILRNTVLLVFALLAFSATEKVALGADQCFDVSGIGECTSCDTGPVCYMYTGGDQCDDLQGCYNQSEVVDKCPDPPGDDIFFCVCDPCNR